VHLAAADRSTGAHLRMTGLRVGELLPDSLQLIRVKPEQLDDARGNLSLSTD
jgi:hypothetical protein